MGSSASFPDYETALNYLRRFADDSYNITVLRRFLGENSCQVTGCVLTDQEVISQVARKVAQGNLLIARKRAVQYGAGGATPSVKEVVEPELKKWDKTEYIKQFLKEHELEPTVPKPTWFEVYVIDEIGEPIGGVPLRYQVDGKHDLVADGAGHSRLDGVYKQSGSVSIDDLDTLRDLVRERWDTIREPAWLELAADTTFTPLHEVERLSAFLLNETLHTLVIQPWVIRVRLIGMYFDTNKCFLLPAAMSSIRRIKKIYDDNPSSKLLAVGHTDTSGEPSYNDPLSLERAESVAQYLTDDVDAWLVWYKWDKPSKKRWGTKEDHLMISSMPDYGTRPFAESPVRWYQRTRSLSVDGQAGNETRRALIREYMSFDETTLPPDVELVVHGCGESFPIADDGGSGGDKEAAQLNRRVELYFFDRKLGVQPPPPSRISSPRDMEYPEWVKRAQHTYDYVLQRIAGNQHRFSY